MKASTSPDSFPPRSHSAKRSSILDAAEEVFCREGYAGANIDVIATEAGVSRQTVYNHHGDKERLFVAVVRELTEHANAGFFATLATFPDRPTNLEADLIAFAVSLNRNCICNREGRFLRKLIQAEAGRYPEIFAEWREQGPGKTWSALAARLARLALAGHLSLDNPDIAARQFLALVNAELQMNLLLGVTSSDQEILSSATNGVRAFLRAFGATSAPPKEAAAAFA